MGIPVLKHRFSEPKRNLPGRKGVATVEDHFTIAFARRYFEAVGTVHSKSTRTVIAMAREIPVNGYGIADLLVAAWSPELEEAASVADLCDSRQITVRAFECKVKDWRSALSQAVRYRYFAHQAIAVVPPNVADRAVSCLDTFKKTRTGLWSFDQESGEIRTLHTPRSVMPKSVRYYHHAVGLLHKATRRSLPIP